MVKSPSASRWKSSRFYIEKSIDKQDCKVVCFNDREEYDLTIAGGLRESMGKSQIRRGHTLCLLKEETVV